MVNDRFAFFKYKLKLLCCIGIGCSVYFACSKKTDCCVVVNLMASFDIQGTNHMSVFDSSSASFVSGKDIKIYYINKNGSNELVNNPNLDLSNGFYINHENGTSNYIFTIQLNDASGKDTSYTLLDFGMNKMDTIKAIIKRHQINKLWWNDLPLSNTQSPVKIDLKYP